MVTRERFAGWLQKAGALKAVIQLRRLAPGPSTVTILTYHHIADHDHAYPYDPDVADATPAQFRRQMEMLVRYGTPIGIDDLIRALEGAPLPRNPVMVTFDDGYRSCHDTALPILRAVGMRATFFVATGYITDRRLYWWERIALALRQTRKNLAKLTYPQQLDLTPGAPDAHKRLTAVIKNTPSLDVDRFLDELCAELDVEWDRALEAKYADDIVMTWDQVRALTRAGMDVESHSRTHRVLQTLDDAALREELEGSRQDLEAQLGRPIRALAYPVGRRGAHVARIRAAIVAAGYKLGFSNSSGVTRMWPGPLHAMVPIDPFDVKRLATDREMSDAMWLAQVAVPRLAYISNRNRD